jgi:hypothetical protein
VRGLGTGEAECEGWRERGISGTWNARDPRALAEDGKAEADAKGNIDADGTEDISVGCTLFLLLFFATSLLMCSAPLMPFNAPKVDCNCDCDWARFGEGGGVILDAEAAVVLLANVPCEYPSGVGGDIKPNLCKYCC